MGLSKRLTAIADMVKGPCILADIGCDHGLLPITLIKRNVCMHAYACDIHQGPLARASQAIASFQMQEDIDTILCDGLDDVPENVDVIVIAGMGWETITGILSANIEKARKYRQIVLQSNNHVEDLRKWINEHGFMIDEENLVFEQHYYTIISIHYETQKLNDDDFLFGLQLHTHPLFSSYWKFMLEKERKILECLPRSNPHYQKIYELVVRIEKKLEK